MDRYGLASGKRMNDTICDREFEQAHRTVLSMLLMTLTGLDRRHADRNIKPAVRRLVRAALDVERQRCFEKGMEAFAAMPFRVKDNMVVDERNLTSGPGFWTGD